MRYPTIKMTILTCLLAGFAGMTPTLKAAGDSESVSKLLGEAKTGAYQISVDATTLESYMRQPKLNWVSHATEIDRMKNDINATAKTVGKLNSERMNASPWQATAIDRIIPLMKEIADDTTAAIEFLNKNQAKPLITGDYRDFIEANADVCTQLSDLVSHFVDYGNTKSRYENLKRTLEVPNR